MAKFLDLLMTGTNALLLMNIALDGASRGASGRVARAEGLVTGAVEDILLVLGMLARRLVMAFVTHCRMGTRISGRLAVPG